MVDVTALKKVKLGSVAKVGAFSDGQVFYCILKSDDDVFVQLTANSSSGHFSREVVSLSKVKEVIGDKKLITSKVLAQAFASRSRNNAPFLMAVLVGEALVSKVVEPNFHYSVEESWSNALQGYLTTPELPEEVKPTPAQLVDIKVKKSHKLTEKENVDDSAN